MNKYLSGLNTEQLQAVRHETGPCLVLAGPGTGKTTVITARTCHLIENAITRPENILVVTFSKAAADEMKNRFNKLAHDIGLQGFENVTFGTFHSIFFRILRQHNNYSLDNLIDEAQKFSIIRSIIKRFNIDYFEEDEQIVDLINDISYFMNTMCDIEDFEPGSCKKEQFTVMLEKYIETKNKLRKFDYDDMLVDCYYLLLNKQSILSKIREKYKFILVDEFQDINRVQYETIKLISDPINNIFVVGDDDQSIYSFRGASPEIMQEFEIHSKGCSRISLKNNYRTTKKILTSALDLIGNNTIRYKKGLQSVLSEGFSPQTIQPEDFEGEAKAITDIIRKRVKNSKGYSDIAIIYRTNIQARALIDGLMDGNIPFSAVDGVMSIYNHWIYRDISSYLKLAYNSKDYEHLIRILNKPKRYISRVNIEKASQIDGNLIDNLIGYCSLNQLQVNALEELRINISRILSMDPGKAVRYIRNNIGYDEYLREYAFGKGISVEGLFEVLDEIEGAAGNYLELSQFLLHVDEVDKELNKKINSKSTQDRVQLMTMHRAKGLEFDLVFISGAVEGLAPCIKTAKEEEKLIEEERRLFYVALTRARKELVVSSPKNRYGKKTIKSRFIEEMTNLKRVSNTEIYIGRRLYHRIFEEGVVTGIFDTTSSKRFIVDFKCGKKELDVYTCIKNDIIRVI